ncbi:ABC transporter ATP-binding protein [Ancylobacter polymorphus]|uniref:ABC transporter ATP-binding protein n=1 Tax=Ancylobacter polymorphus TaxID=223390 RepID=A0A9E7A022_9HYPH|nr:ABC transporter ATP-binding protein [Ancylobacter polymorphus]UOK73501.1 ABC transporter ATP-binding protein [Ancylobacter polymorphus]
MLEHTSPVLEIEDLRIDFQTPTGVFQAVHDISFRVNHNESVAIIGESGSGKSVTANAVLGLLDCPPGLIKSGDIRFRGRSLLSMPLGERRELYGRSIAMVFQDPLTHLNPVYPVGWQIAEVCRIHGMPRRAANEHALELMVLVGIIDPQKRFNAYPHQFSGGQRQRIMIAMAMAMQPDLLIADEPTTALDVTVQARILDLLRRLQSETGMSLLMITHDLGVAADIADRVIVMKKGVLVEEGSVEAVFRSPQHAYTKQLLTDRSEEYRSEKHGDGEVLLEVLNLDIHYGAHHVVKDVGFTVAKGEIVSIVGESGSGKSTVASTILKLKKPSSGLIRYRGKDIESLSGQELRSYNRVVQAVFQDPYSSLNPRMNVFRILSEAWTLHPDVLPREKWRARAEELMGMVGLQASDLEKFPGEFSGGQRQRIAIARALTLNPEVVVCDEAVSALDMTIQAQIITLLTRLRRELGLSYIFIAHDLTLVEKFADRVLVMKSGEIVEQGPTADVFGAPKDDYTRLLIAASPVADPKRQAERRRSLQLA